MVKKIDLPWGQCAVHTSGDGRPLVLVHGFPMDHRMWDSQAGAFDGWRTVVPDLRGLGRSETSTQAEILSDYADDLAGLLDGIGHQTAVFVGLSMGGYILFELIRRHPERIEGLGLVCTRAGSDTELAARGRLEAKRRVELVGTQLMAQQMPAKLLGRDAAPDIVTRLTRMIVDAPPAGVVAALDAMRLRSDSASLLPSIKVPTLVVAGAVDEIVPPDEMRSMANQIPSAQFCEIENAGHVPPMERPGVFNDVLGDFLSGL